MPQPHLRAADADREAVARVLGEHMSAGRLTFEEYDQRLAQAWAAKTYGELAELTADLPGPQPSRVAAAPASAQTPATHPAADRAPASRAGVCGPWGGRWGTREDLMHNWRAWLSTSAIVVTIWLITGIAGTFGYFWPIWVIGPWGAVLLAQTLAGRGTGPGRRSIGR